MAVKPVFIHDKSELEDFFLKNRDIFFYQLGDLDDFFWPYTTWYAYRESGEISAIILLYIGGQIPVMLAITSEEKACFMLELVEAVRPYLPSRLYSHLSPEMDVPLRPFYLAEPGGEYYKMVLRSAEKLEHLDVSGVEQMTTDNLEEILALYATSYPGNWFDPRMLETRQYFGMRTNDGALRSVAGIHVYSRKYKIAALGNITTHPAYRGQGLGTRVTARLCLSLLDEGIDVIGLNVKTTNDTAIWVYKKLGFDVAARYFEAMLEYKNSQGQ